MLNVPDREPELTLPGLLTLRPDVQHLENIPLVAQQPDVLSRYGITLVISRPDAVQDGDGLVCIGR